MFRCYLHLDGFALLAKVEKQKCWLCGEVVSLCFAATLPFPSRPSAVRRQGDRITSVCSPQSLEKESNDVNDGSSRGGKVVSPRKSLAAGRRARQILFARAYLASRHY